MVPAPGLYSRSSRGFFSRSSHTSDQIPDTPVAALPGGIVLELGLVDLVSAVGVIESAICNFYLSVAARRIARADPSLRYTSKLLGR